LIVEGSGLDSVGGWDFFGLALAIISSSVSLSRYYCTAKPSQTHLGLLSIKIKTDHLAKISFKKFHGSNKTHLVLLRILRFFKPDVGG